MTYKASVKFAPISTLERLNDPAWNRPGRALYEAGSLKFPPGVSEVPLLVDHDDDRRIGTVHELFTVDWVDGPWVCARATVEDKPEWLRQYETKASFRLATYNRRTFSDGDLIGGALVSEVSVLSPGTKPAEPLAEVLLLREQASSPAPGLSDRPGAGVHVDPPGKMLYRPNSGRVVRFS